MIMFRPTTEDHPNFTGGNPYFNPTSLSGRTTSITTETVFRTACGSIRVCLC